MTPAALINAYRKLRQEPSWKLLAADTGPETIAVLQTLLFDQDRRLKDSVLVERMLRIYNVLRTDTVTREMVTAWLAGWRKDHYVVRRFAEGDDEPYWELSPGAFEAISFASSLTRERTAPTSGRLGLLLYAVRKLVDDSDADTERRLKRLEARKAEIDREMEAVRRGEVRVASDIEIASQADEILSLIEGMDGDFLRVRDRLVTLSNAVHARILKDSDSAGAVLDQFFEGYDAIQESDEGKTFESFYQFLLQELSGREVDSLVEELKDRWFWKDLEPREREAIEDLVPHLNDRSRETQNVMRRLSSELRQLVQSRSFRENKRMQALLQEVRRLSVRAAEAAVVSPETRLLKIDATRVRLSSPGENVLYDPSQSRTEEELAVQGPEELDLAALSERLNASEIDYARIREAIALSIREQSPVTLGQILERFPATQGLATLVGCLHLALEKAQCLEDQKETITWVNRLGEQTLARIPLFVFTEANLDSEGRLL